MIRGAQINTMEDLLEACGVKEKYEVTVKRERLTLENFVKLLEMDQSGLTSTLLKRCKMSCGDFIELTKAYEKHVLGGKTVGKVNQPRDQIQQIGKHHELLGQRQRTQDGFETP